MSTRCTINLGRKFTVTEVAFIDVLWKIVVFQILQLKLVIKC